MDRLQDAPSDPQLGDFAVMRTPDTFGTLIRFFTKSPVNHAVIYVGNGLVVEARPRGAGLASIGRYKNKGYLVTWSTGLLDLTDDQRRSLSVNAMKRIGTKYSWLDIFALFLHIYGISAGGWVRHRITRSDKMICSQLVDRDYEDTGIHLFTDGRLNQDVTPGDLFVWIIQRRQSLGLPPLVFPPVK